MINQPVFAEKIYKKQHFLDFLDFQILNFQGNLIFLRQFGYYVVVFVLWALIWDFFNIWNALEFLVQPNMGLERLKLDPQIIILLLDMIKCQ